MTRTTARELNRSYSAPVHPERCAHYAVVRIIKRHAAEIHHPLRTQKRMNMRVLIAYASHYGATKGIAERIAATLHRQHLAPSVQPVQEAADPAGYDAVIVGSAAYYFHWMKPAQTLCGITRASSPIAPCGSSAADRWAQRRQDDQGRELREFLEPKEIAEFRTIVHPRTTTCSSAPSTRPGSASPTASSTKLPANRDDAMFPQGDFRNWPEIDAWADTIAEALKTAQA